MQVYCTIENCKHNDCHVCSRTQGIMLLNDKNTGAVKCQQFEATSEPKPRVAEIYDELEEMP